jgi:Ca2+-binding EF-hand superfamily protein
MHEHEIQEILDDLDAVYDGSIYVEEFAKLIYNK